MASAQRKIKRTNGIARGRREAGSPFGRSHLGTPAGDLTDLGCSDCRGVLAVREDGDKGHLSFTCRVGHAFSGESLLKCKEEQLEDALWAAVEVYEEIVLLHREMSNRARAGGVIGVAKAYERRAKRGASLMSRLRQIISSDSPATADRVKA
jgi:two-component system chemotaxis response regulator CheB